MTAPGAGRDTSLVRDPAGRPRRRVVFVNNICSHYSIGLFEALDRRFDLDCVFFSDENDSHYERKAGLQHGRFRHEYLPGFYLFPKIRITPSLVPKLGRGNYDVIIKGIDGRFALPATFCTAKVLGKPFILRTGLWRHPRTLFHLFSYPATRLIYRLSDALVVYGHHVKAYLMSLGVEGEKIFVALNAVDNSRFNRPVSAAEKDRLRGDLDISERKAVLFVGRMVREKGLDYLVEALSRLKAKQAVLVLVGDGPRKELLRKRCRELGLQGRVRFVPYVQNRDLRQYFAIAETMVLPSITTRCFKEPWGRVVNEAMNQACPVIASDAVGAAVGGLIRDGENGWVVPERDAQALADRLDLILADTALRDRVGQAALGTVAAFTHERQADVFAEAVEFALKRKGNMR